MNRKIWMMYLLVSLQLPFVWSQQERKSKMVNVSGFVIDGMSAESLIGASVMDVVSGRGIATNVYGYYTLNVPEGDVLLQISYIGYETQKISFTALKDTVIHVDMQMANQLEDIVVTAGKKFTPSGSLIELSPAQLKVTPVAFGETDVLKTLQAMPGVQAGVEGTSGFYVRGGGMDQNLFLLDGVPVYNVGHVLGLFSVFNGDAVKKVTFHKGSFPARFGGRLSSVVDIRLKDGDMQKYHGSFNIGLLSSRVNLEGPLIKGKTSFNISARRSYIDLGTRVARLFSDENIPNPFMYDMNAKLNHKFTDRSRLYLSFYKGKDKIGSSIKNEYADYYNKTSYNLGWGNTIASLRWNYIFSNKLFMNATAAYNRYSYDFSSDEEFKSTNSYSFYESYQNSGIEDYSVNMDFEYMPNNIHQIRFGGGLIFHKFNPEVHGAKIVERESGTEQNKQNNHFMNDRIQAKEASLYAEDEFGIGDQLKLNLGMHFSLFDVQEKIHTSWEPRASLGYQLTDKWSVKTSYTRMNQYIHLLSSNLLSLPTDLWVPVTKNLKPMSAHQITAGTYYDTLEGYDFSIEGFYKRMNNLLEYKDGSSWGDAYTSWEDLVESGKGWSYGIEFLVRKTMGKLTGTAAYTLGWNFRQFETINRGEKFAAKYDRRHDFNITVGYEFSKKVDISASWMFASGNKATLPLEEYQTLPDVMNESMVWVPGSVHYVESRNNYRLPPTHHLDLNLNYYRSPRRIWSFSVYNIYNRANPYIVYPGYSEKTGKYALLKMSFLRIVPSVSFTCKF